MRFGIIFAALFFPSICAAADYNCTFPHSKIGSVYVSFTQANIVGLRAKMETEGRTVDVVMRRGRYGTTFIDGDREGGMLTVTIGYSIAAADGLRAKSDHGIWVAAYSVHSVGLQSFETEQIRGECQVERS